MALPAGQSGAEAQPARRQASPAPVRRTIMVPQPPRASAATPAQPSPSASPRLLMPGVPALTPVPRLSLAPRPRAKPRRAAPAARPASLRSPAVRSPAEPGLPPGVALFTRDGRPAALADLMAATRLADVLFLGEHHDDAAAHALERAVLEALAPLPGRPSARSALLSLEMFETDVQPVLDEYLAGLIRERDFLAAARPWPNYKAAYRPLLELARERAMPVVAANAPHRYVMRVGRTGSEGLTALSAMARGWLAPLPWPTPSIAYSDRFTAFAMEALAGPVSATPAPRSGRSPRDRRQGRAARPQPTAAPVHGADHRHGSAQTVPLMFEAQWLRDTTMARSIARHLETHPGALVVHVTGLFHSEGGQGTVEALQHYRPGVRTLTVAIARRAGPPAFVAREMAALGDFIAVTPQRASR
ncbi:MAG: ChaN family lipoprotein [Candidatus Sericytochromatia bacterium]|nr:ChaN family lipoprotein [Candidatus Sericytochromatia bacterium]